MSRLIGSSVLILSLAASLFMTPEHYRREVIEFVNPEGFFFHPSNQENQGHNQEVFLQEVKGRETENSESKEQELEVQFNQNQGELLRLREENKKLQREMEKFISQTQTKEFKPAISSPPKREESLRPSQGTTITTYVIRGASLLVTVCFFGFLLRHFFFARASSVHGVRRMAERPFSSGENILEGENGGEEKLEEDDFGVEEWDTTSNERPVFFSDGPASKENEVVSQGSRECIGEVKTEDASLDPKEPPIHSSHNSVSLESSKEPKAESFGTVVEPMQMAAIGTSDSLKQPKPDKNVPLLFEEEAEIVGESIDGSIIDRFLEDSKEPSLIQSYVQVPK